MEEDEESKSVRGVIFFDGKLLVEYFAPKEICFLPGGRVEEGESLEKALRRELVEEVNAESFEIGRYLGVIEHRLHFGNCMVRGMNHFFEVRTGEFGETLAKENGRELRWIELDSSEASMLKPPVLQKLLPRDVVDRNSDAISWNEVDSENMSSFADDEG